MAAPHPLPERSPSGPRDRLQVDGVESLTDETLLAVLLGAGARGGTAEALAHSLLADGLGAIAGASLAELCARPGVGAARAARLQAALELGRRSLARPLPLGTRIGRPADVDAHFRPRLAGARQEEFHVLHLDARHRLRRCAFVSRGTLTASLVHPREVFGGALREAAAAVVLVHNHPSGDPGPSDEDRQLTRRLVRAGELLGIPVLDHVIVARGGFVSLRETGDLAP